MLWVNITHTGIPLFMKPWFGWRNGGVIATLVDGHGNFGSMDRQPLHNGIQKPVRSKIALEMLRDINKNTVDFC